MLDGVSLFLFPSCEATPDFIFKECDQVEAGVASINTYGSLIISQGVFFLSKQDEHVFSRLV